MREAVVLLVIGVATVYARTDIVSQLYGNLAITKPTPPSRLNSALRELVGDVANLTHFPANVQRAMLWSAGWVRAIPESDEAAAASDNYVQVYVHCARTMTDVFPPAQAFDDTSKCEIKECKSTLISFTTSTCEASYVQSRALCALSPDAANWTVGPLQTRAGPLWAMDGQIDDTFEPQIFQVDKSSNNDSRTMFLLAQKPSWLMTDATCPNSAQFIAPCKQVDASEVDQSAQQRTWCEPEIELGVKLWVNEVYAAMGSNNTMSKSPSTLVTIGSVLLGFIVLSSLVACVLWRRSKTVPKNGLHENEHNPFFLQPQWFHHRWPLRHISHASRTYSGASPSFESAMHLEAINEKFRRRAPELATFCNDQELMLKRIAFANIVYCEKLTSGPHGEIWRGEFETRQVAIKCTVVAAVANATTSNLNHAQFAAALLNDTTIQALVAFTNDIRLAACLDHPNLVHFIGLSWRTLPEICMVSDFVACGDLARFLAQPESKGLTWKGEKLAIAADISNALVYLHSLLPVVCYGNLKSSNVLLTDDLQAKLSNFGLHQATSADDTLLWTAPEVLRGEDFSAKADIYAFGVILAELDTGLPPYVYDPEPKRRKQPKGSAWLLQIASGQASPAFRPECPQALRQLASQCLAHDPSNRPSAMHITYMLRSKIAATF